MLNLIEEHILKQRLFTKKSKLLLAFSGGVDSVVLAYILHQAGYQIELAHCNFKLRGIEANDDSVFCRNFAQSLKVPFHIIYFDTKEYAQANKLSIQMAARELRYNWFQTLSKEKEFDYIITAHHANDVIETLLINLTRGTGINGLKGIPQQHKNLVRPLLFATKEQILAFAKTHNLNYREDSSNQEVKYKRNFIRHQIMPQLKQLNPSVEQTILSSISFFKQSADIVAHFAKQKFKEICIETSQQLEINIELLNLEPQKESLLFEWLRSKGFKTNNIEQLCNLLLYNDSTGKLFKTKTHILTIDRKKIIVKPLLVSEESTSYEINSMSELTHLPIPLSINQVNELPQVYLKSVIYIDETSLIFPLILRKKKVGDKFKPFGMNGFKKVSDYFKDIKLSLFEKKDVWILENANHIIWIVGYRMDDRCKVTKLTKHIVQVSI